MFIAFEGPDNTGKSTAAKELDCAGQPDYQVTKEVHERNVADWQGDHKMPHTYDRVDWLSHMVYRLALPDRDWNDDRPRTVFGMPDTHLVFRIHEASRANFYADEVVSTPIGRVNPVYWSVADWLTRLNFFQQYDLFKSISIIEVENTPDGYVQKMMAHDNPSWDHSHDPLLPRMVDSNESLLEFLRDQDKHIG